MEKVFMIWSLALLLSITWISKASSKKCSFTCDTTKGHLLQVKSMVYDTDQMTSKFLENRILKTVYFKKNWFEEFGSAASEFELEEFAFGKGYQFVQQDKLKIPLDKLKEVNVPLRVGEGLFSSDHNEQTHYYDEKKDFFYARSQQVKSKFVCNFSGKTSSCSVVEVKWVYRIPYKGILYHTLSECECGEVSGILIRHDDYSHMIKTKTLERDQDFS